jgi:hypothetical protein
LLIALVKDRKMLEQVYSERMEPAADPGLGVSSLSTGTAAVSWAELDRILKMLGQSHVPLTIMRLRLAGTPDVSRFLSARVAASVRHPSMLCGAAENGTMLVLYLGPRSPGRAGGQIVAETMTRHIFQAVRAAGMGPGPDWADIELSHRWADEIGSLSLCLAALDAELATAA